MRSLSNLVTVFTELSAISQLDVVGVDRRHGVLRINLESYGQDEQVTITSNQTLCLREFDEGDAINYLSGARIGVYSCTSSDLLDWFAFSRLPLETFEGLRHFILVSSDTIVEWLSTTEPTIEAGDVQGA